jgi:FolB domain-containing protein
MLDRLTIHDLEIWSHIGVPEEERESEQRLLVTIELMFDARAAAQGDDVKKSINYHDLASDVHTLARKERQTIERFADDIARMVRRKYKSESVTVTVKKFPAIGAMVSLTISRP